MKLVLSIGRLVCFDGRGLLGSALANNLDLCRMATRRDTLAYRVLTRRKELGLTQEQLANKVGISQQAITQLEKGEILRPRNIQKLADALECSPAWLQFGIEEIDQLDQTAIEMALKWMKLDPNHKKTVKDTVDALSTITSDKP